MNWNTVHAFVSPQPDMGIHPSTAMRIVSYVVASCIGKDGGRNCGGRIKVTIHGCTCHSCKHVTQSISCVVLFQK